MMDWRCTSWCLKKKMSLIDYKIIDINSKYEEILGFKKEEVVGKTAKEIYGSEVAPYLELYSKVALDREY